METNRSGAIRMAGIAVVVAVVALSMTPAYTGDENISVSCYEDDNYLGTVMTFSPETAGQICNSLYYSCKGKCYGCYSDFDLTEDVCYDNAGRKFLK